MEIREVTDNKKQYLSLLLLADEQENMIDRYLESGTMFILKDSEVKAECVVTDAGNRILEIKNIAVYPDFQGKGYGKKAVELALEFVETFPHGKADYCWLCYDKNNEVARKLYLSMGFQEIGEQDDDINAVIKL